MRINSPRGQGAATFQITAFPVTVVHALVAMVTFVMLVPTFAMAQRMTNQVAIFSALDKVTARIRRLEVPIAETIRFGSLKVTPRVCFSRPPEVQPKTTSFVQVSEVLLSGEEKRLFSGWMFAESPGLNAVEHPVFDVWLTGCGTPDQPNSTALNIESGVAAHPPSVAPRRRRRRVRR
ncbi:MAG: DUF2155 domain-containing protein [Hyphomicrobiaceae bacterium]